MVYAQHLKCCEVHPHEGSTPSPSTKTKRDGIFRLVLFPFDSNTASFRMGFLETERQRGP